MLDFTKLWQSRYLFGPNPLALSRSDYIFFVLAAAFSLLGIVCKIFALSRRDQGDPRRLLWNKLWHLFFTMGLLLLLWSAARYENIPWMGTHFVALLLLLLAGIWFGFIVWYRIKNFPVQMRHFKENEIKHKYLPHS